MTATTMDISPPNGDGGMSRTELLHARCTAMVLLHFAIAGFHGVTHLTTPVPLLPWQLIYVAVIITAAPLIGVLLMRKGSAELGGLIVGLSLAASFVFGFMHHFIMDNPDNICRTPDSAWTLSFITSAFGLAVTELAGAILGLKVWHEARTQS